MYEGNTSLCTDQTNSVEQKILDQGATPTWLFGLKNETVQKKHDTLSHHNTGVIHQIEENGTKLHNHKQ